MKQRRSESKSSMTKRIVSVAQFQGMERAEFISSKTDSKQRLGELFIYEPTKLEMFGLRSQTISSKIPVFPKERPLFDLGAQCDDRTVDNIKTDCQKCNQSISRMQLNQTTKETLHLNSPKLQAEERKLYKSPPQKQLEIHQPLRKSNLPPILVNATITKPNYSTDQGSNKFRKQLPGKLIYARLSEGVDYELMKVLTKDQKPKLIERDRKQNSRSIKQQNVYRAKQCSLSSKFKEERKILLDELRKEETQQLLLKEQQINKIIFGNQDSKVGDDYFDQFL